MTRADVAGTITDLAHEEVHFSASPLAAPNNSVT
jgi:hypothetical protein